MDFFIRPAFQQKFCAMHRGFQPLRFFFFSLFARSIFFWYLGFLFPKFFAHRLSCFDFSLVAHPRDILCLPYSYSDLNIVNLLTVLVNQGISHLRNLNDSAGSVLATHEFTGSNSLNPGYMPRISTICKYFTCIRVVQRHDHDLNNHLLSSYTCLENVKSAIRNKYPIQHWVQLLHSLLAVSSTGTNDWNRRMKLSFIYIYAVFGIKSLKDSS